MGFRNLLYRIDFSNNRIVNFAFEKLGQELQANLWQMQPNG